MTFLAVMVMCYVWTAVLVLVALFCLATYLYRRFSTNWVDVTDNRSLIRRSIGYGIAGRYSQQLRPEASVLEKE